jgi:hypothetical protein
MGSWTIYESFDPKSGRLFLDVVDSSAKPPSHNRLKTGVLERFRDFREAHVFLDGYIKALQLGRARSVLEVFCGEHEHPGCDVGPCKLGVTPDYRCSYRDRDKRA